MIRSIVNEQGFVLNEQKVKYFQPEEPKMVTGLKVTESSIELQDNYLPQLQEEIGRLNATLTVEHRFRTGMSLRKLNRMKQELTGKINFAAMALGHKHKEVIHLENLYDDAINPPKGFESVNWLDVPYDI